MKHMFLGFYLLCIFVLKIESKPQITKLLPIAEIVEYHQEIKKQSDIRPLDKILGKLRATYNFVFHKPEDTSNIERIFAKNVEDLESPETFRLLWNDQRLDQLSNGDKNIDRLDDLETHKFKEFNEKLELEEESSTIDKLNDVEIITTERTDTTGLTPTFRKHLLDWIGSLLGITYGIYAKLVRIVHSEQ